MFTSITFSKSIKIIALEVIKDKEELSQSRMKILTNFFLRGDQILSGSIAET